MNYHLAKFDRGTGLGNRMFPWARAIVAANQKSEKHLRPKWENIRLAPLLAGNIKLVDLFYKFYLIGNFKLQFFPFRPLRCNTILYKGLENYFSDLRGYEQVLYKEFLQQSKLSKSKEFFKNLAQLYPVMVNIRMGRDFNIKYNLDFFLGIIKQIKSETKENIGIAIITDSYDDELLMSLNKNGCTIIRNKKAVDDLYLLSLSSVIIGSGGSSFCCWPSFFQGIPLIIQPDTPHDYFNVFDENKKYLLIQRNYLTSADLSLIKSKILKF